MVEFIDLLSSPPPPIVVKPKVNRAASRQPSSSPPRSSPRQKAASAALARQCAYQEFSGSDPFASSPAIRIHKALSEVTGSGASANGGASGKTLSSGVEDGFLALSSDIDDIPDIADIGRPSTTAHASIDGDGTKSAVGKARVNETKDFFFLSDDFDSTIDLNQSYSVDAGPVAKKRRISPVDVQVSINDKRSKSTTSPKLAGGRGVERTGLKRTISDVTRGSKSNIGTQKESVGGLRRSKTDIAKDDPIVFTSSPDVVRVARDRREKAVREKQKQNQFDDDDDDIFANVEPSNTRTASSRQTSFLEPLDLSSDLDLPDLHTIASQPVPSLSRIDSSKTLDAYKSSKASDQKARDKARVATEKAAAKEAEKERKRLAKEEKAREKQAAAEVAKVNTLRTDKRISTPEMIVDLPTGLDIKLVNQVRTFLSQYAVQVEEWDCVNSVKDVIRWRRKVEAKYNEELGYWEPTPKHIRPEKHVLCVIQAKEFVDLTCADEGKDLDAHVLRMKSKFGDCAIIYLVEGLTSWMRKNKNVKNRQFADAVRNQNIPAEEGSSSISSQKRKSKAKEHQVIDEDMIEDSLLRLQVVHGALLHHTATTVETAQWVVAFTQHISTIPYRHQKMTLDTAFCMEAGQVKTGDNPEDTFIKMLQEVTRITAPIAYGIASEYPSVQKLVKGFESGGSSGKDLLQTLRKSANNNGAFTDRTIGQRISRRLWNIFMSREEDTTDI